MGNIGKKPTFSVEYNHRENVYETFTDSQHRRKVKKKAKRECSGHVLIGTFLKLPIFCEYCCEFMWGTMAYRCRACDVLLHKACEETVGFDCPGVDHGRIKDDSDLPMHIFKLRVMIICSTWKAYYLVL